MKIKSVMLTIVVLAILFSGCTKKVETPSTDTYATTETPATTEAPAATETTTNVAVDGVTSPSIVDTPEGVIAAAGPNAFWLLAITKDVTVDADIVVEGEYEKADKDDATKMVPAGRKIALYAQDAERKKTASYTLTANKMIVKSQNTKIQGGTFVGDVYVESDGFNLVDATIDGNVYFSSEDYKTNFVLDEKSKVTGTVEVKK